MKKIMLVFGTRPEAIKMCPLIAELKSRGCFDVKVCVTGQHRQMLGDVLSAFKTEPDFNLNIMRDGQTLSDINTAVLSGLDGVLEQEKPELVLVHGDTTTTFAAALACYYRRIPVGHVEAGLRTYDIYSPFPEEFNRRAVSIISALNFAPTRKAADNLLREGAAPDSVFITGNTAIDALKTTVRADYTHPLLDWAAGSRLILLTAHRRENLGAPMESMFAAVRDIAGQFDDVKVIYPVHLNPQVRKAAAVLEGCDRVKLTEPLGVLDFHNFLARAYLVLTDSGGIQEEAPALNKPVLVMRGTTERPEGVEAGTLLLVGTQRERIVSECLRLLLDSAAYDRIAQAVNPYGDGTASKKIADIIGGRI